MKSGKIEIGKAVAVQGLKGEVRVEPWCDSPEFILPVKRVFLKDGKMFTVEKARVQKNIVILKLGGVDDIDAANALRNQVLCIDRAEITLPPRTYFIQDLIGLNVIDADDRTICYGVLSQVSPTGANDVYHVKKDGMEYLIPAIKQVVIETDLDGGEMLIRPLEGLFDDED